MDPDKYENVIITALELPDGSIVTGRNSYGMVSTAAVVLNALKKLAGIDDKQLIISKSILESLIETKRSVFRDDRALDVEEVIMALTLTKMTNPTAEIALAEISKLRGCIAHCTAILSDKDEASIKALGIDITSDPEFAGDNLYSE